jgi:hypothetical protein
MGRASGLSLHGLGAAPAACQNQLEREGPQHAFQITTTDSSAFSILCIFLHSRHRSTFTFATLLARRSGNCFVSSRALQSRIEKLILDPKPVATGLTGCYKNRLKIRSNSNFKIWDFFLKIGQKLWFTG